MGVTPWRELRGGSAKDILSNALRFQEDPQDAGARLNTAEDCRARATRFLGNCFYRIPARPESQSSATPALNSSAAHGGTGRLSVLNRRQLCRWQNLRLE